MRRGRGGDLGLRGGRRRLSRAYVIAAPSPPRPQAAGPAGRSAAPSHSDRLNRAPLATRKAVRLWLGTREPLRGSTMSARTRNCRQSAPTLSGLTLVSPHSSSMSLGRTGGRDRC